ncbi:tRNA nucleotidyltransferase [Salmonella phage PHA46]
MKKYIVGGFVRDKLLGLKPKDKDYVLVGAKENDIQYLISQGYEQVGADFPVFLSPQGDEYALARVERKSGSGYKGFTVETEGVTIEQDLFRRDLTINAIAYDPVFQKHVDPYNGKTDLANKVLRHVSEHFAEDPLRVLRLARFATRYSDFTIHESTEEMVRNMVSSGDIDSLTPERVYVEFEKAFTERLPSTFIFHLKAWGAIKRLLPGLERFSKADGETINKFATLSTEAYTADFMWSYLLSLTTAEIKKDYTVGQIKLPARFVKFHNFIKTHEESIKNFRKKTPEQMVDILSKMNIHNNGGEAFLYKVLEYFNIQRETDGELEDLIVKVYDRYENTVIGDIDAMVKDGLLEPKEIRSYVANLRTVEVAKMFA